MFYCFIRRFISTVSPSRPPALFPTLICLFAILLLLHGYLYRNVDPDLRLSLPSSQQPIKEDYSVKVTSPILNLVLPKRISSQCWCLCIKTILIQKICRTWLISVLFYLPINFWIVHYFHVLHRSVLCAHANHDSLYKIHIHYAISINKKVAIPVFVFCYWFSKQSPTYY